MSTLTTDRLVLRPFREGTVTGRVMKMLRDTATGRSMKI